MGRFDTQKEGRELTSLLDGLAFDSFWVGDHVAFTSSIPDPLLQLAQVAVFSERLSLGTSVYLLPLRAPAAVAKQIATLDNLSEGRLTFGVGVGGEFPAEFAACGVDPKERGARLNEGIEILRALWRRGPVSHAGEFWHFSDVELKPLPFQQDGPPIWCGARANVALKRIGRLADGWMSYVVTPERYAEGLKIIERESERVGRRFTRFGSGHLLFVRIDDSYDRALDDASAILSKRYAMDFRRAAERYCALGPPERVAQTIKQFHHAGVRHIVFDMLGTDAERRVQLERFAAEIRETL